jgi:hypothetical protein
MRFRSRFAPGRDWICARALIRAPSPIGAILAIGIAGAPSAASAASYVDAALGEIKPADKTVVANPQPVQLLFEFQTKGALNARGTKILKDKVVDAVKSTGVFSEVSDTPTANGAVLQIIINDAPHEGDEAAAEGKGFVTGATFFVAGSTVRENYDCTINYVASPSAPPITRTANDGIYFQLGLINSPPPNAVKIGSLVDAEYAMTRFIVINPLNALAADPAFQAAAPAAAPTAAPAPTSTAQAAAAPVPAAVPLAPASSATAPPPAAAPTPAPAPVSTPNTATPTAARGSTQ